MTTCVNVLNHECATPRSSMTPTVHKWSVIGKLGLLIVRGHHTTTLINHFFRKSEQEMKMISRVKKADA
jgi:hypothetical protein